LAETENFRSQKTGAIELAVKECIRCKLCIRECGYLQKYGKPGEIFERYLNGDKDGRLPFECNLCGLCTAVCPKDLNNNTAFLQMRQELVADDDAHLLPEHSVLCRYEKMGRSPFFTLHGIDPGCDTIFFPGCTLTGTRAETTLRCYKYLKNEIPGLGIVLDCCSRPSHDLGRDTVFSHQFNELCQKLKRQGVKRVITACPSCLVTFREYAEDFESLSVYELLASSMTPGKEQMTMEVTIHDTCVTRNDSVLQDAVRRLITVSGIKSYESEHSREKTVCCGEGAAAGFVAHGLTEKWASIRKDESGGRMVITYCAGCSSTFGSKLKNIHLLDLLFQKKRIAENTVKVTRSPFTYWKRFALKWRLKIGMNKCT